jgi:hypothetical protein
MLHLLHRQGALVHRELSELKRLIRRLMSTEPRIRFGVGAGVCLANKRFLHRFCGMQWFQQVAPEDRAIFFAGLSDLESSLRNTEPGMALGVGLYQVWLADTLAGRRKAAELLGALLTELSRRAANALPPES